MISSQYSEFIVAFINKKLSINSLNDIKGIRRLRRMKEAHEEKNKKHLIKYAFCEKTTKDKLEAILANFRPNLKVPVTPRDDRIIKNHLMLLSL